MKTEKPDAYSWEEYFAPHILARGLDYCREGAVTDLQAEDEDVFSATVQGTEDYRVEIEMEDGIPTCMECDCPYADRGYNCKHMAAVLYAIEERGTTERELLKDDDHNLQEEASSIEQLVERIPDTELRTVLSQLCHDNIAVYRWLALHYPVPVSSAFLKKLRWEMEQIRAAFSDRHDFINWENADDFEMAVTGFMIENTRMLLACGEAMLAFQFVNDTLQSVSEQDIDDDGHLCCIASVGADCWTEIMPKVSSKEKEELFRWFSDHLDAKDLPDYLSDTVANFYETEFQEPYFLEKKLERCLVTDSIPDSKDYWNYHFYVHKVKERLELMEKLSYPDAKIRELIQRYYEFHEVRDFAVDYELKQGKTDKAIELLRKSKELDADYPGLVADYSNRLIGLYEKMGREDECKQELIYQIFRYRQSNTDNISMLKNRCSQFEWEEYREKIFVAQTCAGICLDLMAQEGLDERLLESVIRYGSLYMMDEYEKRLKRKYPEKLRDAYAACTKRGMLSAGNRNQYAGVIHYLKKIMRYPGGKEIAIQIAAEWRRAYPRRRAMLEELSRAGF